MATTDLIRGKCPKCGEPLEIPSHLKEFSCMYCGNRLTMEDLLMDSAPAVSAQTAEYAQTAAQYYKAHVLETITNYVGIEQELSKQGYAPAFDRYLSGTKETFVQLNKALEGGALTLEEAAEEYLNQLEDKWKNTPRKSLKQRKSLLMDTDKFVIAIFLIPALQEMGLPCGLPFCEALRAAWMKRYPKSVFNIGTFEGINGGFKKKLFGLCFITTAVCQHSGKPDDCAELTAFRSFRDGYLRACPDGPALIDEYYATAPSIVLEIEKTDDRDARYAAIRQTWLEPCFADLQKGNLARCKERYTAMVRQLQQEYLS